jgi:Uma2 family endonuclease
MELEQKCVEYWEMGIRNVWVINPQRRIGRVWHQGAWIETKRFAVDTTEIYLDLEWLFAELDSAEADG